MDENSFHIAELIRKTLVGELSHEDRLSLDRWILENHEHKQLFEELTSQEMLLSRIWEFDSTDTSVARIRLREKLRNRGYEVDDVQEGDQGFSIGERCAHRIYFFKTYWFRYAAAILLVITAISLYYNFFDTPQSKTAMVQNVPLASDKQDVLPGFNRAVLTLSNGQTVELDSAASETIKDGALSIENNNGQLNYSVNPSIPSVERVSYNTMTTPRGGQYQLTLSDGTRVWLNAASSITYPVTFKGKIREVNITGEAYFEVSKNKTKPFIVKTFAQEITVLGTSFNVNSYTDEQFVKTSLVEGSVKIGKIVLQPGQAFINGKILKTDIEQDIAWKKGVFAFKDADLPAVMRQISKWYNVDVEYAAAVSERTFSGKISRSLTLQQVLNGLASSRIKFKLVNKNKILILP